MATSLLWSGFGRPVAHCSQGRPVEYSGSLPGAQPESGPTESADGLEDDDRDVADALGLLLVLREPVVALLLRGPDTVALLALRLAGDDVERVRPDLDADLRVGQQVVVPVRVLRVPALGGEDGVA